MSVAAAVGLAASLAAIFGLQINITFQLEQRWTALQSRLAVLEIALKYQADRTEESNRKLESLDNRYHELVVKLIQSKGE